MHNVFDPFEHELMTEREAAQWLNISPRTLQAWRRLGRGPNFRKVAGTLIRYSRRELVLWLNRTAKADSCLES